MQYALWRAFLVAFGLLGARHVALDFVTKTLNVVWVLTSILIVFWNLRASSFTDELALEPSVVVDSIERARRATQNLKQRLR